MKEKDTSSKRVTAFLHDQMGDLRVICAKIKNLQALTKAVVVHLEPQLVSLVQVANVMGDKLILVAANGSIATQIRFQNQDLLRKFRADAALQHIRQIECKVRPMASSVPSVNEKKTAVKPMQPLSPETADMLNATAETLSDPALKNIMLRIASRVKK